MEEENGFTEWQVNDQLPGAFVAWLQETITEKAMKERKGFMQIAGELNVDAALLSRWLAGMGPLTQEHIENLAKNLSPAVYTVLGHIRPDNPRPKISSDQAYPR